MKKIHEVKKEYFRGSLIIAIFFSAILLVMPNMVLAEELEGFSSSDLSEEVTVQEEMKVDEEVKETLKDENKVEESKNIEEDNTLLKEEKESTRETATKSTSKEGQIIEEHKVLCITTKVDEDGNPLEGAVLQIIDSNGNVVDEWTSNGESHETMLTEGVYTLHEVSAPEGYKLAADKEFTVKVEIVNINAGVDFSETPCEHYGGTPLYYVEIEGEKYEVYCINQDWETPDDNSVYDGKVLTEADITDYTKQTVFIDTHQNKEKLDISEKSLTKEELYNKVLDIVYHRQKASSVFSDLTEAEIRCITEVALKNYTNAGLTRVQRIAKASAPVGYDRYDYYITSDGKYIWYLYPWYRSFIYTPDAPLGKNVFITDLGNGDAFGTFVRHWNDAHNAKNSEEVRAKLARYYELYLYLISDNNPHPSDMHLYIFMTNNKALDLSGNDFDDGAYQNLLGIRWYNPDDENHKIYLTYVNEKAPVKQEKKKTNKKVKKTEKYESYRKIFNPSTGDSIMNYIIMLPISLYGMVSGTVYLRSNRREY